ncbi:uncharacterized protein HKW66_Vig0007090 [Vigna angularis]|uniref:Uncharacterized protein n=3 Tax=Phaseolus angularis TaxID=3914 RepID=A0A8T0LDJ9_PHAAN|nr:uncharacterized protein HKW66_Vig0007090 [Vigna angularis]
MIYKMDFLLMHLFCLKPNGFSLLRVSVVRLKVGEVVGASLVVRFWCLRFRCVRQRRGSYKLHSYPWIWRFKFVTTNTIEEVENAMEKFNSYPKGLKHPEALAKEMVVCASENEVVYELFKKISGAVINEAIKTAMKNKIDELKEALSDSWKKISCLEKRIVKELSDKLEAINSYGREKEARTEAEKVRDEKSAELEKFRDEKSVAEKMI